MKKHHFKKMKKKEIFDQRVVSLLGWFGVLLDLYLFYSSEVEELKVLHRLYIMACKEMSNLLYF